MKTYRRFAGRRTGQGWIPIIVVLACTAPRMAAGQAPMVAQYVIVTNAVLNEFDQVLPGTETSSHEYGIPPVEGALVQFLHAVDNTIYPPDTSGKPHVKNVELSRTHIGKGVSPGLGRSGRFAAALTPRPGGNSRIFVRVFNAATIEESSFYCDSSLFIVRNWKNDHFQPAVLRTDQPLDAADSDSDGVNNSWERSYGSDPQSQDTDGDGLSDKEEILSGTDLLDGEAYVAVILAELLPGGQARLVWRSVAGQAYRIEFGPGEPGSALFETVTDVVAEGSTCGAAVSLDALEGEGNFRVVALPGSVTPQN